MIYNSNYYHRSRWMTGFGVSNESSSFLFSNLASRHVFCVRNSCNIVTISCMVIPKQRTLPSGQSQQLIALTAYAYFLCSVRLLIASFRWHCFFVCFFFSGKPASSCSPVWRPVWKCIYTFNFVGVRHWSIA